MKVKALHVSCTILRELLQWTEVNMDLLYSRLFPSGVHLNISLSYTCLLLRFPF